MRTLFLCLFLGISALSFAQLTVAANAYSTQCSGSATGLVELTPDGAVGEVTYSTNLNLNALLAGDYSFEAQDESGQVATVSFTILDRPETCGCTYPLAFNYDLAAEVDNGSCVFASDQSCLADIVPDGVVGTNDLLQLLVEFGVVCE
ncbi:MAG: hypothetical protein CBC74_006855 [Crocinitomicaceae bacterium TMED114]|nr:MAG: hypothetical protein CBC74_006855 [Crocinitomicaceae bacterium TMED114]|tara:strand:- start:1262 stop:1705 length:444 start_codon:yes stop_codon:yes gene_type:complete